MDGIGAALLSALQKRQHAIQSGKTANQVWCVRKGMIYHEILTPSPYLSNSMWYLCVTDLITFHENGISVLFLVLHSCLLYAGEVKRHNVCKRQGFLDTGCKQTDCRHFSTLL